jgi:hypothetical protein
MTKKQKRTFLLAIAFLFMIMLSCFVFAQNTTEDDIDKAYSCLENEIEDKGCNSLSLEEKAFSLLTVGECKSELLDQQDDDGDWDNDLRKTAISILALERVGYDTEDAEEWLLSQKEIPEELIWYLEIDTDGASTCEINGKDIDIRDDKKISGSAGRCFSLAQSNYWLEIDEDCYDKNFTITCDKDFISTLLYRKGTSSTIHVSSETESAPAEGTTEHSVNAFCFSKNRDCNYEGSLWATLALAKTGRDVSSFLPYLVAMAEDNEKYFPSAFLYMITDYDEYFSKIIQEQTNDYWEITNSLYNKFYDSSLALVALYGLDAEQVEIAKEWLLAVQGNSGCWHNNNIRDTAFVLYAAWPRQVSVSNGDGGSDIDYCEEYDYFCVSPLECSQDDIFDSYYCSGSSVCCRTDAEEETCDEKGGRICSSNQTCTSAPVMASDTSSCCLGSCIEQQPSTTECEEQGYGCRYSCLEDEEEKVYSCNSGKVCCAPEEDEGGSGWIWIIILLLILIGLTVLAIIYRDHLKVWFFKLKNKLQKKGEKKGGSDQGPQGPGKPGPRPPSPPTQPPQRPRFRPRRMFRPQPKRPPQKPRQKPQSKTDKELDETLKKLKEMSK